MNILQILPELNVGGVETGTLDLAKHLVRLGHKAVVVSAGGKLVKELESYGVTHYELPVNRKSIFTMLRMASRLAEIIKKEKIDIIHARSRAPAWIAYFSSRRSRALFITTCHGYYTKHLFSYVMGWGKRVIAISNVVAQHMICDFGTPYERIRLIPRGVDLEKFRYLSPDAKRNDVFNVGIIGRITPIKGHTYFIKAMANVAKQVPKLRVWVVGDAASSKEAYKEQLQILVKRSGLRDSTVFLGTQRDISEILSHLDVLVLASTCHEAFGRVIVEAQACGIPVVATRVGGVVDIIEDEQTGLLVPPADPDSMAWAVIKIFRDVELSKRLAQNAYNKVREKYNLQTMLKQTMDVYQEALTNYKILIIKLSSVGDVILSTAGIRAIRQRFTDNYKISVLVDENSKDVLLRCPYIDELIVCDLKGRDSSVRGFFKLGTALKKKGFDTVIDLQNSRKSHILSFLTQALDRYGYDNHKFGFLLNHRVADEKPEVEPVTHQFRMLRLLNIELKDRHLELWPSEEDKYYIDEFLNSQWLSANQKIVGINIAASQRWITKNWPLSHIARLCEELSARDIRVVITGAKQDLGYANSLISMLRDIKIINACGRTTLNQLACLIKRCGVYISSDSAPLHIAASQDIPFIALFGPTDPLRHLPPAENFIMIKKDIPCSPCYKSKCGNKKCMELITPREVLEAVEKLMK